MAEKKSKMGGMKLGNFSGIKPDLQPEELEPEIKPAQKTTKVSKVQKSLPEEKPVAISIKISRSNHEWLNGMARVVRDNNIEPVPAADRVFPQHLISAAIDLLRESDIDWSQVKNIDDLKQQLEIE